MSESFGIILPQAVGVKSIWGNSSVEMHSECRALCHSLMAVLLD